MPAAGETTRIILIRHGESQCNVDQVVGGHEGCTGLSEHGREQAALLRDRLARTSELDGASSLYASILPRAVETAEIIAPALGDLEVRTDCELCEGHAGEADTLAWAEVEERWGPTSPSTFGAWAPGVETWAELVARTGKRLTRLAEEHRGETVVIACHGGVVDSSFSVFGAVPLLRGFELHTTYTSMTEWVTQSDPSSWPPPRWRLARYNDAAHLTGG